MVNSLGANGCLNYEIIELGSKVFIENEPKNAEMIEKKITIYRERFSIEFPYQDDSHLSLTTISAEVIRYLNLMPKLVSLDLSNSSIEQLPAEINYLKLSTLDLTNHKMAQLPDSLGSISSLRTLKISSITPHFIPKTIIQLNKLKVLEVNILGVRNLEVLATYLEMRKWNESTSAEPKELITTYTKESKSVLYEWVPPRREKHQWNLSKIAEPLKIALTCLDKKDLGCCFKISKLMRELINNSVSLRKKYLADGLQNYLQTTLENKKNIVLTYNHSSLNDELLKEILHKLNADQLQLVKLLNEKSTSTEQEDLVVDADVLEEVIVSIPAPNPPTASNKMYAITSGTFLFEEPLHPFLWFNDINRTLQQASGYTIDWSAGYDD